MSITDGLRSEIADKMSFDLIRYSQVWEDHTLLESGLLIDSSDDVLSICSAGCNALAMLLCEPRSVTVIDLNPSQIALLELKLAAISELNHDAFVCLLGVREGYDRLELYHQVKDQLTPVSRRFWDARTSDIESGIVNSGRLERYFQGFQQSHLHGLWSPDFIARLLTSTSLDEQARLFTEEGMTSEFEHAFRIYFGREKMAAQGRDPAQFEHVEEGDVGRHLLQRFMYACTQLPLNDNFYIEHFLTSQYRDITAGPPYLRAENFERLRGLIHRMSLSVSQLETRLYAEVDGRYSKANLSDIFEYMSVELSDAVFHALAEKLRPDGRLAYWNFLVPRQSPVHLRNLLQPLEALSESLWRKDRAWFYRSFTVEQRISG